MKKEQIGSRGGDMGYKRLTVRDLKSCPHCGEPPKWGSGPTLYGLPTKKNRWVECPSCGLVAPMGKTITEAICNFLSISIRNEHDDDYYDFPVIDV